MRRIGGDRFNWLDQMLDIGKRDAVVIFDIRRYSGDVAAFARQRRRTRRHHRALHRPVALAGLARRPPRAAGTRGGAVGLDSSAGLLLLVEAVLSAVARELGSNARSRLTAVERLRGE
ncbi:MAG: hypothetical protein WDM84_05020 [Bauldia sp.]